MKLKLTVLLSLVATMFLYGQTPVFTRGTHVPPWLLYKHFIQTNDSGFLETAYVNDTAQIKPFVYMIKYNSVGNIQWSRRFPAADHQTGMGLSSAVVQSHDGGYLIATTFRKWIAPLSTGRNYACLVKTDSAGNLLWSQFYPGDGTAEAYGVCETSNHEIVVCGMTRDTTGGPTRGFVFRTDSMGNPMWSYVYDQALGSEQFFTVQESVSTDLLIYGVSAKKGLFVRLNSAGTVLHARRSMSLYAFTDGYETSSGNIVIVGNDDWNSSCLYEITSSGTEVWIARYQYGGDFLASGMVPAPGGYTMVGLIGNTGGGCLAHVDYSGNTMWVKQYSDMNSWQKPALVNTFDNGYCFSGEFVTNSAQDHSIIVIKTDSLGVAECNYVSIPDSLSGSDTLVQVVFAVTNGLPTITLPMDITSIVIPEVPHCIELAQPEAQTPAENIRVYPNPANNVLFVECSGMNMSNTRIRLCDVTGRVVVEEEMLSDEHQIDMSSVNPGLYFLLLERNGVLIAQKPVIRN